MHPSSVSDGHNGIFQAQYAQLISKTDMRRIEDLVEKNGPQAWRDFVKVHSKSLAKSSTTTGVTTGLGLNFLDLRAPAYMLDPIFAHIRNSTPRWDKVNAGYGVQPQWKAVTQIDAAQQFPGVSEGNTNSNGQFTLQNFSAPYVTLGTDDFVTYESISASEGYEDALGDGKMWQLLRFIRQQERSYLGGAGTTASNGALQIGTTNTPTGVLSSLNNANFVTGVLPVGSYVAAYAVALNYRAAINPGNTVSAGITTEYLRSNADGSADVINGGSAIVSAASNVVGPTVTGTKTVTFSCTPQAGAWGYAWFVEINTSSTFTPNPALAKLTAIVAGNAWMNIYGQTQGTQTAAYSGSGGYAGFASDLSTNSLDMDGLLTITSNTNYSQGLPTPTVNINSFGTAVTSNVWNNHGAGLTNNGMPGTVKEFDGILFAIQQAALTGPTTIYLSTDQVGPFRSAMLVGATTGAASVYFFPDGGPTTDGSGLSMNTLVARYHNVFGLPGGMFIDVKQHPYLPAGTVLFDVNRLQETYSNSRLGETRGVFVRRDTYGIEFAQTSRKYPFGVFSEEVLAVKTPNLLFALTGLGAYGATNVF
jgi:hypothetical protein